MSKMWWGKNAVLKQATQSTSKFLVDNEWNNNRAQDLDTGATFLPSICLCSVDGYVLDVFCGQRRRYSCAEANSSANPLAVGRLHQRCKI